MQSPPPPHDPYIDNLVRWRSWVARFALVTLPLGLILILVSHGMAWIKQAQNREFHQHVVAPSLQRSLEAPSHPPEFDHTLDAWLERQRSVYAWLELRSVGYLLLLGGMIVATSVSMTLDRAIQRRISRPERPAFPDTGEVTRKLAWEGKPVIARARPLTTRSYRLPLILGAPVVLSVLLLLQFTMDRPWVASASILGFGVFFIGIWIYAERKRGAGTGAAIEIDPVTRRIVFRHFAFLVHFNRNPVLAECTLHASDILGVEPLADNQGRAVAVRTTRGRVALYDRLENYDQIVALLADFAESNRLDPVAFRAAIAREPKLKTPWWGWLLLVGLSVGVVGGLWWLLMRLG